MHTESLPTIFRLPSELCDRHASPEIQAKQIAYQSRPWVAYVSTKYTSGGNHFDTMAEALDDIISRQDKTPASDFWFYLEGPGGVLPQDMTEQLLARRRAKLAEGRVSPAHMQAAVFDLRQQLKHAPWYKTTFTVHVPARLSD